MVSFLDTSLVVLTSTSTFAITNKVCLNCSLLIRNIKFLVNFSCIPLSQVDKILGMNWLSSNQVHLNYAKKSVIFLIL